MYFPEHSPIAPINLYSSGNGFNCQIQIFCMNYLCNIFHWVGNLWAKSGETQGGIFSYSSTKDRHRISFVMDMRLEALFVR